MVGFAAMCVAVILGTFVGTISGYMGGKVDVFCMRIVDVFLSVPSLLFIIVVYAFMPRNMVTLVIMLAFFSWTKVARVVRAQTLTLKERDFVLAAKALGVSNGVIILQHIIPNLMPQIIVAASLSIANAILDESTLSFLGYGVQLPMASWGSMLQTAQKYILHNPVMAIAPGLMILITVLCFNVLGDMLQQMLDPKMKVRDIIAEGIRSHHMISREAEIQKRVEELLVTVGLDKEYGNRHVHEFSGGQRQRIGIARALAVEPEFIVCDEPISALDVSIQAQIVNLLGKLQKEKGLTYMFIAHDLSMVKYISDRVMVMYLGKIVEITASSQLYSNPAHPYTKALLSAIPIPDPKVEKEKVRIRMDGEIPSPINPPKGCRFQNRCRYATEKCKTEEPELKLIGEDHYVACHKSTSIPS
ncbi:MAG: oligopeptide/dipeptide ABC transporter ATP-binding protein [Lachnospiraceae bacterium]